MHTFKSNGVVFNFNSDLSGDVLVVVDRSAVGTRFGLDGTKVEVIISGEALIEFIGQHVMSERIGQIEQMEFREVLGLKKR